MTTEKESNPEPVVNEELIGEGSNADRIFPPDLSEEDLKTFVTDFLAGKIFTDRQVRNGPDIPMVFMVLALGGLEGLTKEQVDNIGLVYEYLDKAAPRSINGEPIFFSCRFLNVAQAERAIRAIQRELEHQKNMEI